MLQSPITKEMNERFFKVIDFLKQGFYIESKDKQVALKFEIHPLAFKLMRENKVPVSHKMITQLVMLFKVNPIYLYQGIGYYFLPGSVINTVTKTIYMSERSKIQVTQLRRVLSN